MNIKEQNTIMKHIVNDFHKYDATTMEAVGLLESIKLSLYIEGIKKD